jgi:hypothetical protein
MDDSFDWNKVIKKEAKSNDNKELGEIQGTEYSCLVVERGLVHKEFFYIPKDLVENYDGKTVKFRISEEEIEEKYVNKDNIFDKPTYDSRSTC